MPKIIVIWGLVAVVSAFLGGILASAKRRDYSFWATWSFLVPPMLILLLFMPVNKGPVQRRPTLDELERGET